MKIIAITGAAGFLGTNLATLALQKNYKVIAFDNLSRKGTENNVLEHENYQFIKGDIRNPDDLKKLGKVDGICHLAANPGIPWSIKDPVYDFYENAVSTLNVLEYARNNGKIPVLYASTNKVYSDFINHIETITEWRTRYIWGKSDWVLDKNRLDRQGRPSVKRQVVSDYLHGIDEKFPVDGFGKFPHSPYGVSKLTGDLLCQEYWQAFQVPTVINRMSCLYGKYQQGVEDQGWVAWFMIAKILGKPLTIYGDGKQVRDALYGDDIAELYLKELEILWSNEKEKVCGKVFNIGGGWQNTISLLEAIELIDILDEGKHPAFQITYKPWRFADQKIYYSNIERISAFWKPKTSVSRGFNETFNWIEENQNLFKEIYG